MSRNRGLSIGSDGSAATCVICLGVPKFPTGKLSGCTHVFCFLCIKDWVKRRSECPLCKSQAKFITKTTADGATSKVSVAKRTAAHYNNDLNRADEAENNTVEVDITVAYARCRVCRLSNCEGELLLCDGEVGEELDGRPIRCNAAYHIYCLPTPLDDVPRGRWYCPFCADLRETQRDVYNRRYVSPRVPRNRVRSPIPVVELDDDDDDDMPGPSRPRPRRRARRRVVIVDDDDEEFSEDESSSETSSSGSSPARGGAANDPDTDEEPEASFTSGSEETSDEEDTRGGGEEDWDAIDSFVLDEPDDDYVPDGPRTAVRRRRTKRKKKPTAKKGAKKKKARKPKADAGKKTSKTVQKKRKKRTKTKRKSVTRGQRRLASVIGIDLMSEKATKEKSTSKFPADGIRRGPTGIPALSLLSGDNDELPSPEPEEAIVMPAVHAVEQKENTNGDFLGSILEEQVKTLAPARYQKVGRDGRILDTERMTEHRKRIDEKIAGNQAFAAPKEMNATNFASKLDDSGHRTSSRSKRPSRWGSPTPAVSDRPASNTASIPLPAGPPMPQKTPLDFIPVPQPNIVRPPITSNMNLNHRPSAMNTSPSTSFALNAFASPLPPFGMNPGGLGAQPGMTQLGSVPVPQQPLLQLPSQLFPGLLMQPPLSLGAMNNLLAAGLIGNHSLAPQVSQAPPFIFGQVSNERQDFTQQLANLASSLHPMAGNPMTTNASNLSVGGVPPPPPSAVVNLPKNELDLSISKPLADKIRLITEGHELRPLAENNNERNQVKATEETKNDSGRKSASAEEEEEASEIDVKVSTTKNGPMFNQARQMLSVALKKVFKKRLITKDEYKMIMKKGVTALAQRTKLDQTRVDEYANKYVQCVIHRRKKKH